MLTRAAAKTTDTPEPARWGRSWAADDLFAVENVNTRLSLTGETTTTGLL